MKYYTSLFTPDFIYVWMEVYRDKKELVLNNLSHVDLLYIHESEMIEPEPSNFLSQALTINGWEDYFVDFLSNKKEWLIKNGITPGQPFLVKFYAPHGYKTWTDYGYEYDCDYEYEIVTKENWKPLRIKRAWNYILNHWSEIE